MQVVRTFKNAIKKFLYNFLIAFAKGTSIPGVPLMVAPNLYIFERIFWFIILLLSGLGAMSLTFSNWNRYNANPTVVTIQKDFRNWKNILPAATGCFTYKFDPDLVEQFVKDKWNVDEMDSKYDYYVNFVKAVANTTYRSLEAFAPYENDEELNKLDYLDIAIKVYPELTGTLVTFETKRKSYWRLIMTEIGLCFIVNNKFAKILKVESPGAYETPPDTDESVLKCHYLNGLCYARFDSEPQSPIDFYIHSYLDVVHINTVSPLHLGESQELEINYMTLETSSSESIRSLAPHQRKCRFDDEPLTKDVPVYSTTMCYVSCRFRLAWKFCGCRPFFYPFIAGRVCNVTGMLCLSKYAEYISRPPEEIGCQCPQPCEMVTYFPLIPKVTHWKSGYFDQRITFRWGIVHPTTKFRREIIFGFEDLVVSLGGTFGLFLGISFITLVEIIFFVFEFLFSLCSRKNKGKKKVQSKNEVAKNYKQVKTVKEQAQR